MSKGESADYVKRNLGCELSQTDLVESSYAMLEDDMAAKGNTDTCNHNVTIPHEDGYICSTCHEEMELRDCNEVWINLTNAVTKVKVGRDLKQIFG